MRRFTLLFVLVIGCAAWFGTQKLGAQEPAAEKPAAASEGENEPSAAWKWANFAILAIALGYGAAKALPPFFRSRTESIQKGISEAQQMKRDAEKRAADMEARLKTLGAEIEKFRAEAHGEMEQEGARIRQETARQIERLQQQAEQEIEAAGKTARRELKQYAAKLALDLAEQRVRDHLDPATETALVDGFVRDLQRQESKN